MKTVLVAGASGKTGHYLIPLLKEHGYKVRVLCRNPQSINHLRPFIDEVFSGDLQYPVTFACENVDIVISSAGASLTMDFNDRTPFYQVDYRGNANLLTEAQKSQVEKFVYVSVFGGASLQSAYTNAHERFVALLQKSGLVHTIIRPTGFFYVNAEFLALAQKNRGMVIGSGDYKTNPIHEADVAEACIQALSKPDIEVNLGGPEIFTRHQIVEMAYRAIGKTPTVRHVPAWLMRSSIPALRLVNKRIAEIIEFGVMVSTRDCIAPTIGARRLEQYFSDVVRGWGGHSKI